MKANNSQTDILILNLQNVYQIIKLSELSFCKSENGYTTFYLSNGKSYLVSKPLKHFEDQLPSCCFIRTHQSYYVNINHINRYDKRGFIILDKGQKIPVSNRKREFFLNRLLNN